MLYRYYELPIDDEQIVLKIQVAVLALNQKVLEYFALISSAAFAVDDFTDGHRDLFCLFSRSVAGMSHYSLDDVVQTNICSISWNNDRKIFIVHHEGPDKVVQRKQIKDEEVQN